MLKIKRVMGTDGGVYGAGERRRGINNGATE
jgi:hypothetical protein